MKLELFTHENVVGKEISKTLKSGKYTDFKIAVAYSRNSGIGRIYNELLRFSNNGGKTSVIAGIDQGHTSYQALSNLKVFAKDNMFIHYNKNRNVTFHPKIYLFGNNDIERIIVGSSNLTAGGLFSNYEANVDVTLDNSDNSTNFKNQVNSYWNGLLKEDNTKECEDKLLHELLEKGIVLDEQKQKHFNAVIEKIDNLPFKRKNLLTPLPTMATGATVHIPSMNTKFAMTISNFDVSQRSSDPIILIPIAALKAMPSFWNWPRLYTNSGAGYPQLYATATILIDGKKHRDKHIRIYCYEKKTEFRLQCEAIKRNGKQGDIVLICRDHDKQAEYKIELVRSKSTKFSKIRPQLINKVSPLKCFAYF